ncbi:MAG: sigma 54-interacting transcriptional regulator, partial [Desulfamplus sp.]|nr:sigma 54-interacting transcriptional regulator [Desulfamplus sp.]
MVNSIHNISPLLNEHKVIGAICFIREFASIGETVARATLNIDKSNINAHTFEIYENSGSFNRQYQQNRLNNGTRFTFEHIIGDDADFIKIVNFAKMASATPSPIMIYGETGTGKELFAQSIHNASNRRNNSYVAINCAAIPENLLEGILFGTTKGAFTGSLDKVGLFEEANGGTILLDEINSMSIGLQAKLLRTLQEKKVRRIGSLKEIDIDIKIISSTNEPPQTACNLGKFRKDLFYRLGVVFIQIPPLRDRKNDLEKLVGYFLSKCNKYLKKEITTVSSEVMQLFYNYHWPGNVRELEHIIEGAMNVMKDKEVLSLEHISVHIGNFKHLSNSHIP